MHHQLQTVQTAGKRLTMTLPFSRFHTKDIPRTQSLLSPQPFSRPPQTRQNKSQTRTHPKGAPSERRPLAIDVQIRTCVKLDSISCFDYPGRPFVLGWSPHRVRFTPRSCEDCVCRDSRGADRLPLHRRASRSGGLHSAEQGSYKNGRKVAGVRGSWLGCQLPPVWT